MGKSNRVECKKLDVLTGSQKCAFCHTTDIDEIKYGPIYMHKTIITHYYCLLLSSNMEQNGRDSDGILGFLPSDINKEVKRGARLYCSFCRVGGATLGCAVPKCKVVFHLPCGMKRSTLHQFFGEFKSFCAKHRPVQRISENILAESSKGAMCGICYEKVVPRPIHETLWAPCCQKNAFFHRDCVQKLATSAGYFFKCPLCNNTNNFQEAMKEFGIYIPEQDASWECVPHAYQDLLVRHDSCDSAKCSCPNGRKTNIQGTRWELILCKYCGSQGIHIGCGRLKWKSPEFECDTCCRSAAESEEVNRRNYNGNRHRLSGVGRTADIHPSVSADRERDAQGESSSEDSLHDVTISNRKIRVLPSPHEQRSKTPQTTKLIQKETVCSTIMIDDFEDFRSCRPIVIDDDSDDELEVVCNSNRNGCLKTVDGATIPVVQMKSSVQKRLRVEGDVKVLEEVVDITSLHMQSPSKKPKVSLSIETIEYSLQLPQPSTSASYSVPSTSFAPDLSGFIQVDPNNFRPEDIPPGTVMYRSVQPLVSVPHLQMQPQLQPQIHLNQPQLQPQIQLNQPQLQPQIQAHQPQIPTSVPMQQLGSTCNADAQHSNLCKHWSRGSHHLSSKQFQKYITKTSREVKRNSPGRRRRGRDPGCDNNRLSPRVMIAPLKCRISSDGHFEILVPRRISAVGSLKRKASPLPARSMKKKKISSDSNDKTSQKTKYNNSKATIKLLHIEQSKKLHNEKKKTIKTKSSPLKQTTQNDSEFAYCKNGKSVITDFFTPMKVKTQKKRVRKPKLTYKVEERREKVEIKSGSSNKTCKNKKQSKRNNSKNSLVEEWKCKGIDAYLRKIDQNFSVQSKQSPEENTSLKTSVNEKSFFVTDLINGIIESAMKSNETCLTNDSFETVKDLLENTQRDTQLGNNPDELCNILESDSHNSGLKNTTQNIQSPVMSCVVDEILIPIGKLHMDKGEILLQDFKNLTVNKMDADLENFNRQNISLINNDLEKRFETVLHFERDKQSNILSNNHKESSFEPDESCIKSTIIEEVSNSPTPEIVDSVNTKPNKCNQKIFGFFPKIRIFYNSKLKAKGRRSSDKRKTNEPGETKSEDLRKKNNGKISTKSDVASGEDPKFVNNSKTSIKKAKREINSTGPQKLKSTKPTEPPTSKIDKAWENYSANVIHKSSVIDRYFSPVQRDASSGGKSSGNQYLGDDETFKLCHCEEKHQDPRNAISVMTETDSVMKNISKVNTPEKKPLVELQINTIPNLF